MKLTTTNQSYSATIVRIGVLNKLEWLDNLVWFPVMGYQALVSKDLKEWDIGILFTAESRLSKDFCKNNNLYRQKEFNKDQNVTWYIEQNRRVRAIKLKWHNSNALFVGLSSLSYLTDEYGELKVWDSFNEINGELICEKHINQKKTSINKIKWKNKVFERINNKRFPEHLDSDNFWRNQSKYKSNDRIIITQKLHGTSGRIGNVLVKKKLNIIQSLLNYIVDVNDKEYDIIYGSRRAIKNGNKIESQWFYENDVWKIVADRYREIIPKDYILYWEIIWWDWQKAIQKNYTYNLNEWELEFYVYRISIVNQDWIITDLSWEAIKEFCNNTWMKHVPELEIMTYDKLDIDLFMDKRYMDQYKNVVSLSDNKLPDEWVIIRTEWIVPYLTKAKCQWFLEHETKVMDTWDVDMETQES